MASRGIVNSATTSILATVRNLLYIGMWSIIRSVIYNTYKYSKESMRGTHSELSDGGNGASVNSAGGLNKDDL